MRIIIIILIWMLGSCNSDKTKESSQHKMHSMIEEFSNSFDKADNSIKREEMKQNFLQELHSYLKDSLNSILSKYKVLVSTIQDMPWGDNYAIIFNCSDDVVDYWFEQHFPTEDDLKNSEIFHYLSSIKENAESEMTFEYLSKLEITKRQYLKAEIRIGIIPMFDSTITSLK